MEYKGYNIEIQHHENLFPNSKNLTEKILGRLYGKPMQQVYKQDNLTIYKKTAIIYKNGRKYGYGNTLYIRIIYFANVNNKTGVEVYIKYAPGKQIASDVEIMLKKVLCQEIYKTCGIKLTKQN